jgi:hypothetical protein
LTPSVRAQKSDFFGKIRFLVSAEAFKPQFLGPQRKGSEIGFFRKNPISSLRQSSKTTNILGSQREVQKSGFFKKPDF